MRNIYEVQTDAAFDPVATVAHGYPTNEFQVICDVPFTITLNTPLP
jgi:hypothetical protein